MKARLALLVAYHGLISDDRDELIEKTVGQSCGDTGFFFPTSTRDLTFYFDSDEDALQAKERLRSQSESWGFPLEIKLIEITRT